MREREEGGGSGSAWDGDSIPSWTSSADGQMGTAHVGREGREGTAVTGGRGVRGQDRQGQGSEHTVSRLHDLLFLRSQAPAPPTHDHVCTRTHTGLKSRHIPGS